jgi:large subunit ribosomal protein L29
VKKLRQLRKEIAQIKTVAKERELGIRGAAKDTGAAPAPTAVTKKGAR